MPSAAAPWEVLLGNSVHPQFSIPHLATLPPLQPGRGKPAGCSSSPGLFSSVVCLSPMRTEGPEHLYPPLNPSCANWLFGEWFWKGILLSSCGENCQGSCRQTRGGCKCFSAGRSSEPPKTRWREPIFRDTAFPARPMSPLWGHLCAAPRPTALRWKV